MARPNKFAEMVKIARENEGEEESVAVRDRGRPAGGKRSNPDYVTTTIFLRKDTKKKAATILLNRERIYRAYWSGFCRSGSTTIRKCENVQMCKYEIHNFINTNNEGGPSGQGSPPDTTLRIKEGYGHPTGFVHRRYD